MWNGKARHLQRESVNTKRTLANNKLCAYCLRHDAWAMCSRGGLPGSIHSSNQPSTDTTSRVSAGPPTFLESNCAGSCFNLYLYRRRHFRPHFSSPLLQQQVQYVRQSSVSHSQHKQQHLVLMNLCWSVLYNILCLPNWAPYETTFWGWVLQHTDLGSLCTN